VFCLTDELGGVDVGVVAIGVVGVDVVGVDVGDFNRDGGGVIDLLAD